WQALNSRVETLLRSLPTPQPDEQSALPDSFAAVFTATCDDTMRYSKLEEETVNRLQWSVATLARLAAAVEACWHRTLNKEDEAALKELKQQFAALQEGSNGLRKQIHMLEDKVQLLMSSNLDMEKKVTS